MTLPLMSERLRDRARPLTQGRIAERVDGRVQDGHGRFRLPELVRAAGAAEHGPGAGFNGKARGFGPGRGVVVGQGKLGRARGDVLQGIVRAVPVDIPYQGEVIAQDQAVPALASEHQGVARRAIQRAQYTGVINRRVAGPRALDQDAGLALDRAAFFIEQQLNGPARENAARGLAARDAAAVLKPPAGAEREARAGLALDRAAVSQRVDRAACQNAVVSARDPAGIIKVADRGGHDAVACGRFNRAAIVKPGNRPGREARARAARDAAAVFREADGVWAIIRPGRAAFDRARVFQRGGAGDHAAEFDAFIGLAADRAAVVKIQDVGGLNAHGAADNGRAAAVILQAGDQPGLERRAAAAAELCRCCSGC